MLKGRLSNYNYKLLFLKIKGHSNNSLGILWRRDLLIFNFSFNPPPPPVALLDVDSSSSDLIGCCHGDGEGEERVWGCEE